MPDRIFRFTLIVGLAVYFGGLPGVLEPRRAAAAVPGARRPFPARGAAASGRSGESSGRSGGWWLGTAGAALALAVVGGLSVAARRFAPAAHTGGAALRVVGRTSLSPRHAVYLVRAGDRVLVLGTGPQGPPSLLGELEDEPSAAPAQGGAA